jgi:MerR family transcriptional regulator, mercuric resistance operon regulatory protein
MRVASQTEDITIGTLSRLTGVHIETIRYYERIKMLPKPPRTFGGRRTYDSTHVRLLAFIKRSRELGFSPDDIRALLQLGGPEKASCRQVRDIALDHPRKFHGLLTKLEPHIPDRLIPPGSKLRRMERFTPWGLRHIVL